jgi:hypothetical protein
MNQLHQWLTISRHQQTNLPNFSVHILQLTSTFVRFNSTQLTQNLSKIKMRPITEIMKYVFDPLLITSLKMAAWCRNVQKLAPNMKGVL